MLGPSSRVGVASRQNCRGTSGVVRWSLSLIAALGAHAALWGLCRPTTGSASPQVQQVETLLYVSVDSPASLEGRSNSPADTSARASGGASARSPSPPPRRAIRSGRAADRGPSVAGSGVAPTSSSTPAAATERAVAYEAQQRAGSAGGTSGAASGRAAHGGETGGTGAHGAGHVPGQHFGAGNTPHGPVLLTRGSDPCRGLFPWDAQVNRGRVTLELSVDRTGRALATAVVAESPERQGFARAARDCVKRLRFEAAVDELGRPVAASSRVRLAFGR